MAYALRESPAIRDLNVTPLIDVLLVLLVVFMLAAPPIVNGVQVDFPRSDPDRIAKPERIVVGIGADGRLFWDGVPLVAAALAPQLVIEARRQPQPVLAIDVNEGARFEAVADVLAAADSAGMKSVGFVDDY
jgi:biopolymer transport protein ExbD